MVRKVFVMAAAFVVLTAGAATACQAVNAEVAQTSVPAESSAESVSRGAVMRDLTSDDLVAFMRGTGTAQLGNSAYCAVLNGTMRVGDEIRIMGDDTEYQYSTVEAMMSAHTWDPITECTGDDVVYVVLSGVDSADASYIGRSIVYSDSDIVPVRSVTIEVTEIPDAPYDFNWELDNSLHFGNGADECYYTDMTLVSVDGDVMTLDVDFLDCGYTVFPGMSVNVRYAGSEVATGTVTTVYLPE